MQRITRTSLKVCMGCLCCYHSQKPLSCYVTVLSVFLTSPCRLPCTWGQYHNFVRVFLHLCTWINRRELHVNMHMCIIENVKLRVWVREFVRVHAHRLNRLGFWALTCSQYSLCTHFVALMQQQISKINWHKETIFSHSCMSS